MTNKTMKTSFSSYPNTCGAYAVGVTHHRKVPMELTEDKNGKKNTELRTQIVYLHDNHGVLVDPLLALHRVK